jgi:transcriptional regulator with PAS, ATPase and Fis domain
MIASGEFREDLYYRLNVINIVVPPLRERREDIPLLADHFLEKYCLDTGKKIDGISEPVMKVFMEFNWPGNIRQLENTIEHAVVVAKEAEIQLEDLPEYLTFSKAGPGTGEVFHSLDDLEKKHILVTLQANRWNVKKSAQVLGINRVTLYNKIKKYGLKQDK